MPISTTFNPIGPVVRAGQGASLANREDLSSELQLLAPEHTPMLSLCGKGKQKSMYTEWNIDRLKTPVTTGIPEGLDATSFKDKFASRARQGAFAQIFREEWLVSNLQNAAEASVATNAIAAQAKAIREVKRNIEATICSANEMSQETGNGVNYMTRGFIKWVQATAQAVYPVPADYRTPAGSIITTQPTETSLNDALSSVYSKTGQLDTLSLIAGISLRKAVANFQRTDNNSGEGVYNVTQEAGAKKMVLSVQSFDSDFGIINMINGNPDCVASATTGYLVNPKFMKFSTYIPLNNMDLPNQGGGERGIIECVGAFQCLHPQAHGLINY
jgi:Family of unknown function (DUF5309)